MKIHDVTLRDGNHALRHQLTPGLVTKYCSIAESAENLYAVEVGHGNGLGASSFLVGKSKHTDHELLTSARESLRRKKLAVHTIPGFATIKRDIAPAISIGVDLFRVATHVSEADVSQKHIEYLRYSEVEVQGVLMMSHMISVSDLVVQAKLMEAYGANGIIIMDSAGYYKPTDVRERISALRENLDIEIGFHAHNNLGVAITNALTALHSGAEILDGSSMGLGAGAGNAQLENLAANLFGERDNSVVLDEYFKLSDLIREECSNSLPRVTSSSVASGLAGVFSGYAPQVTELAAEFNLSTTALWSAIGERKLVAGQESMIREIAKDLMNL